MPAEQKRSSSWIGVAPGAAAVVALMVSGAVLLGWAVGDEALKRVHPSLVAMNPMTAVAFMFAAVALWRLRNPAGSTWTRASARLLAVLVVLIGLARLIGYFTPLDLGIDARLFRSAVDAPGDPWRNRMAPNTATSFILLGVGLLLIDRRLGRGFRPGEFCALTAMVSAALALLGYATRLPSFYGLATFIPMAVHTAALFFVLSAGLLLSRADHGLVAAMLGRPEHMTGRNDPERVIARAARGQRELFLALAVALILSPIVGTLAYMGTMRLADSARAVVVANETLQELGNTLSDLKDAESGQRGFVITGDERYLTPLQDALESLPDRIERLRELTRDQSVSQAEFDALIPLIHRRLKAGRDVVEARRAGGFDAARAQMQVSGGKQMMDELRLRFRSMIERQEQELSRRIRQRESVTRITQSTIVLGTGALVAIIALAGWIRARAARRQAESALRSSEVRFQTFMDNSPAAAWILDGRRRLVYVNRMFSERLGLTPDQLMGRTIDSLVSSDVAAIGAETDEQVLRQGRRVETMLQAQDKDGVTRPWFVLKFPLTGESGRVMIGGMAIDMTKQVRAEQMFQSVVEAAPCGMIMTDSKGLITMINPETERLLGYSGDELIGRSVDALVPPESRGAHAEHRTLYHEAPTARRMGGDRNLFALAKNGRKIPVEIGISPLTIENQTMVLATIVDISQRLQAEEEIKQRNDALARSNAELEQFAYVASHDLQEPLRMVGSYLQLLERRYKDKLDADGCEFIGFAVDGANRMKQLINDLLGYSRVDRQGGQIIPTDVSAVLIEVRRNLQASIDESGAQIVSGELPTIPADPMQLRQLLQNLISNAIKFRGEQRPALEVSARREGLQWTFSVRDNGIGLEPQYADRIFEVFQRLHTRAEYPGTGIGLAICKKIVERHGGRIWVESEPGRGATFHFTWPATQEAVSHEHRRAA